jgi:hypothetical protein
LVLKSRAAAERPNNRPSRDFHSRSIFDFFNGIDPERTFASRIFLFSRDCLGKNCGCLTSSREIIPCGPHFLEARAVVAIETREPRKGY